MLGEQPPPADKAAIAPAALLQAFGADWLDADRCREWLLSRLHPEGPRCPHCGCPPASRKKSAAFSAGKRVRCSQCRRSYNAATGTLLESSKLGPAKLVLLLLVLALDSPTFTTADLVDVDAKTIQFWRNRLEEVSRA